ncbi:motile sperm domain-containing protein 2-like protein [Dinothrombium tinctorium]|uniref:Motile sperm domain-containing protein 2-like protein n=1 Tax=Dinothrombium tinctorium TaxID=1965070 RepID=A0A3S3P1I5_9ACAR|nr:motile sperm domain-containing protein 2-like protein [Dinothrombium tinctorium]
MSQAKSDEKKYTNKSAHIVQRMRNEFLKEYARDPNQFDERDAEKVKTDDWFVKRFLLARNRDEKKAQNMLISTLRFFKEKNFRNIKPNDFPGEIYSLGGIFTYENDKEGNGTVYMRIKFVLRVSELKETMKKFASFLIFNLDEQVNGQGITAVVDFKDCGMRNCDLDLLWFAITTLTSYCPYGLTRILVVDLPKILQTFWFQAKYFIPSKWHNLIVFVDRNSIADYIEIEKLPKFLGGTCNRPYRGAEVIPDGCPSAFDFVRKLGHSVQLVAELADPQYVCSSTSVQQNGSLIHINAGDKLSVNPINCYYMLPSHGVESGTHFYEFTALESQSSFVGFTTKNHFAHGFRIRGLFYDGSLSSGGIFLSSFGPKIRKGDKVFSKLELTSDSIKMYVKHNERKLGLAFDVPRSNISALYPAISVYGDAVFKIRKLDAYPSSMEYEPPVYKGIEGDYKFEEALENGTRTSNDEWKNFELQIENKPERSNDTCQLYNLNFVLVNFIRAQLTRDEFGKDNVILISSSAIGIDGEAARAEIFVKELLSDFGGISVSGENFDIISKHNTQLKLKRFVMPAPKAVTKNPFLPQN